MNMRRMAVLLLTLAIVIPARADDLDRLRTMLARSDFEGILHEPMPATAEGRAIRVWALYGSLAAKRGEAEVAAMERELPDDPWTLAARAHVLLGKLGQSAEMLAVTEKMLAAAPKPVPERMVRMRLFALKAAAKADEARALLDASPRTPLLISERANL